jgi:hypothetical protein
MDGEEYSFFKDTVCSKLIHKLILLTSEPVRNQALAVGRIIGPHALNKYDGDVDRLDERAHRESEKLIKDLEKALAPKTLSWTRFFTSDPELSDKEKAAMNLLLQGLIGVLPVNSKLKDRGRALHPIHPDTNVT